MAPLVEVALDLDTNLVRVGPGPPMVSAEQHPLRDEPGGTAHGVDSLEFGTDSQSAQESLGAAIDCGETLGRHRRPEEAREGMLGDAMTLAGHAEQARVEVAERRQQLVPLRNRDWHPEGLQVAQHLSHGRASED